LEISVDDIFVSAKKRKTILDEEFAFS
jgi:hypothetical protein